MATVSYQSEFFIAGSTLNGFTTGDQFLPDVVGLSNGGFAVIYGNSDAGGNDTALVTFYDSDYNQVGAFSTPYADSDVFLLGAPKIIQLTNGNVLVAWDEDVSGDGDILGAIFTEAGVVVTSDFIIATASERHDVSLAALTGGGFVAVYNNNTGLDFETFTAAGVSVGGLDDAGVGVTGTKSDSQVTGLANGNLVVTYTNNNAGTNGGEDEVYAAIFNGTTQATIASGILVSSDGAANQSSVAALSNGNFAVVSANSDISGTAGISLSIYNATGGLVAGSIRVDYQLSDIESDPDITVLENDYIVISWTDPSSSGDILSRVYDASGNLINIDGTGFLVQTTSGSADEFSSIDAITSGAFAIAWQDSASDGSGGSIHGQVVEVVRETVGDNTNEVLTGDALRDAITALGGADTLFGGGGDDILRGNAGNDRLEGGADDDTLFGGGDNDVLRGDAGNDLVIGGDGEDTVTGQDGNDDLRGGNQDDLLRGGDGLDTLNGADGNDLLFGQGGNDTVNGTTGNDTMKGNAGDDFMTGGPDADTLFGGDDNDNMNGGGGNDSLAGQLGADTLLGSTGADTLKGNGGADSLKGGNDNDVLFGGNDNDTLEGGAGDDSLLGNLNDDLLAGGAGNDTLKGGSGNDTFVFAPGGGADEITDFTAGAGTLEVIDLTAMGAAFNTLAEVAAVASDDGFGNTVIDFGGGDTITLTGVTAADLHDDDFIFGP